MYQKYSIFALVLVADTGSVVAAATVAPVRRGRSTGDRDKAKATASAAALQGRDTIT